MIDPHSGIPAYRQLTELLRSRITAGDWPPGSLLPPAARLRYDYQVGKATVKRALDELRSEGLIEVDRGIGTRVRETSRPELVLIDAADEVSARTPTPDERKRYDVPEGVPLLVVTHADGLQDLYPAHTTRVAYRPG